MEEYYSEGGLAESSHLYASAVGLARIEEDVPEHVLRSRHCAVDQCGAGGGTVSGSFMNTWIVFQVQYYDMPRLPGNRIESASTLGRKCWAFAYLKQFWNPVPIESALAEVGLSLSNYSKATRAAIPLTMTLCERVMANCFINSTFTPSRNGTCPFSILEFKAGFVRENVLRDSIVKYPFLH
eukprot:m.100519 g.100519  ORF g.100519 m.100519 type:complete len:182 (-) comp20677_c0_seq2:117-662(-)